MIVQIEDGTSRLGIRVLSLNRFHRYVADWRRILLSIFPGQMDVCCGPNGSPWILHGCWYGLPTEVDTANPPKRDFPAISIPAHAMGDDCELEFVLPERFRQLPYGRYTGMLQFNPGLPPTPPKPRPKPKKWKHWPWYAIPFIYRCQPCGPKPHHCEPEPPAPVPHMHPIVSFDIDYGPRLSEHAVDYTSVTLAREWCDEDGC